MPAPRAGAVGVGVHAVNAILPHLPVAGFELAATCARHLDRAEAVGRRFGAALAFDDVERMLGESELDAVVVVVPPEQFAGVIGAASELEHFRRVVGEGVPCESDIASAAATLDLTRAVVEFI